MRTAPAWLGVVLGLTASRTARPEPCARATLSGDAPAIAQVGAELVKLGVISSNTKSTTMPPSCKTIAATVLADPHGIAVAIDGGGEQRVVGDAQIAATWIDSWLRGDDFELAQPAPAATSDVLAPPGLRDSVPRDEPHAPSAVSRIAFGVGGTRGYGSDGGAAWTGVTANACVHVGAVCLGVRGRAAWQASTATDTLPVSRRDLAVLATASTQFTAGQMVIGPELGFGVGQLATTRTQVCHQAPPMGCNGDPTTGPPPPQCSEPPAIVACGDPGAVPVAATADDTRATVAPRASLGVRIAIPLFAHVWLDGEAGVEVSPFGRAGGGGDPTMMTDPAGTAGMAALPGEPFATFTVGLGLRIGGGAP